MTSASLTPSHHSQVSLKLVIPLHLLQYQHSPRCSLQGYSHPHLFSFIFIFLLHGEACRILFPQPGTEPGVRERSPNHWVSSKFLPATLYPAATVIFLMPLPYQSRLNIAIKIKISPTAYKILYALATATASATLPHSCPPAQDSSHSPSYEPCSLQPQGRLFQSTLPHP